MGFDAVLKRYFPAVICVMIAIAAYFQASGIGQLVASSIASGAAALTAHSVAPKPPVAAATARDHETSAERILGRNPFDSVTGPLDGANLALSLPTTLPPENTDPYKDPVCDSAKVVLITAADDPEWSFAAIAGTDGKAQLRRLGDEVGPSTVHAIVWDTVWLMQNGSRCRLQLFPEKGQTKEAPKAAESKPKGGSKLSDEISSKIKKVSEAEFNIERSVVDTILENQAELMKSARIVPEKEGDKVVGIRLFGIKPDSLLGVLGLENGDRLQAINGFDMASPEKALEAYARLRTADHLTVAINRKGKNQNIDFNIK